MFDGQMGRQMDGWIDKETVSRMEGHMEGQMEGKTKGRMNGGWRGGWMEGQTGVWLGR